CTRTFDVSGSSIGTFGGDDYPDINTAQGFVYSDGVAVWQSSVGAIGPPTLVDNGNFPRIADGTNPEVVYIKNGQIMSKVGPATPVVVAPGIWADVNISGTVVFEQVVSGFSQVLTATATAGSLAI